MSDEELHEGEDPLRLARLAIFCCVFGAAIVLGVTMACVRQQPPVRLSQQEFIVVTLRVESGQPGITPLLNIRIQNPWKDPPEDLPLESLAESSLRSRELGMERLRRLERDSKFHVHGLSYFAEVKIPENGAWSGVLVIENPGQVKDWKFGVRWMDVVRHRNTEKKLSPMTVPSPIRVQATVMTANKTLTRILLIDSVGSLGLLDGSDDPLPLEVPH